MTPDDLATLREKAEKATPGRWVVYQGEHGRQRTYWDVMVLDADGRTELVICEMADLRDDAANAVYIAAASPDVILSLLSTLEAEQQQRARLERLLTSAELRLRVAVWENEGDKDLADDIERWRLECEAVIAREEVKRRELHMTKHRLARLSGDAP